MSAPAALVRKKAVRLGEIYEFRDERIEIISIEGTQCAVRSLATKITTVQELCDLEQQVAPASGDFDLRRVPEKKWERAKKVKRAVVQIIHYNITGRDALDKEALQLGISRRQLQRYVSRYRANPYVSSCVPMARGRPKGVRCISIRIDLELEQIIKAKLRDKAEETSLAEVHDAIVEKCEQLRISPPSDTTVWRRLKELGHSLSRRRQMGPAKYSESIAVFEGEHKVGWPGAEYQIDHTQCDIMVTDETRQLCLGRPWLTLVIDTYSGCIVGFYLSFSPPSIHSVARALTVAVMDKTSLMQRLNLNDLQWTMSGVPSAIFTDRAAEFKCEALLRGCDEHGIKTRLRPIGKKHWGGLVERLIGKVMGRLHLLPGTTFSNIPRRIRYDPEKTATFTGNELMARIVTYICEHHDTVRGSITPQQIWDRGQKIVPHGCLRPPVMPKFYRDFLPEIKSKRLRDGIHWGDYRYRVGNLRAIPVGTTVRYLPDHLDSTTISLILPNGDTVQIPRNDEVTYANHEIERQLRIAQRYDAKTGTIGARRDLARAKGRAIDEEATKKKLAARALAFQLSDSSVVPEPNAGPVSTATDRSPRAAQHVGQYVPPARVLLIRRHK
jgi:putative transposase